MTVNYAAVHVRNTWRSHSGRHDSFETATNGPDGAFNLLRNMGRVGREMRELYGEVHAVFVWEDTKEHATIFRLRPGSTGQIERAEVPVSALGFSMGQGPSLTQIEAWFGKAPPGASVPRSNLDAQRLSKYDPLIAHLASCLDDELVLRFAEVEGLLGDRLPDSARAHAAWWGNTLSDPTHTWANRWMALGWRAVVNLPEESVVFRRHDGLEESNAVRPALVALRPSSRESVMDLVEQAGIDVSAWGYTADGRTVENPRANPHFCYDWSFGTVREGFVLCLWHGDLEEAGGRIFASSELGTHRGMLEQQRDASGSDGRRRSRLNQQIRRSRGFEEAVEHSWRRSLPVRVIINDGRRRSIEEIGESASRVELRALDALPWYVHSLGAGFDRWQLVRGIAPGALDGDAQPPDLADSSPGADDRQRFGAIKVRRGQAEFRATLIGAYGARCAVTGSRIVDLLEAAHIVPHAEGRDYRVSNGLLLRADIHTLYDLHLLSIDERCRVHLSKAIEATEYRRYRGELLMTLPATLGQQPSADNLRVRHTQFLAEEATRPTPP